MEALWPMLQCLMLFWAQSIQCSNCTESTTISHLKHQTYKLESDSALLVKKQSSQPPWITSRNSRIIWHRVYLIFIILSILAMFRSSTITCVPALTTLASLQRPGQALAAQYHRWLHRSLELWKLHLTPNATFCTIPRHPTLSFQDLDQDGMLVRYISGDFSWETSIVSNGFGDVSLWNKNSWGNYQYLSCHSLIGFLQLFHIVLPCFTMFYP